MNGPILDLRTAPDFLSLLVCIIVRVPRLGASSLSGRSEIVRPGSGASLSTRGNGLQMRMVLGVACADFDRRTRK